MNNMAPSSYRCLSCQFAQMSIGSTRRMLHTTSPRRARKPAHPNLKASDLGLVPKAAPTSLRSRTKAYTEKEKALLSQKYSEEQMAIIEMGEAAVSSEDLAAQGIQRSDANRIAYFDDFSTRRPIIDHPEEGAKPDDGNPFEKTSSRASNQQGGVNEQSERETRERRLMQQTGLTLQDIDKLKVKRLFSARVVNQTRMGKISSFYTLTIAGNGNGLLGIGEGKSAEPSDSDKSARNAAIRNMKPIPRYEDRTIYGNPEAKVCASIVQLFSRPPGFGNRCQSLIFEMARAAGIQDIAARTPRSRNKMNTIKAAYKALLSQRTPEEVAKARGRKMVDVRKVYYAGSVP